MARHLIFSLVLVCIYLLLNRPEVILVSNLGFTVWFPATGLILAVMLCISPFYSLVGIFAFALAGAWIYHQPIASWGETVGAIASVGSYAGAACLLRGPFRIDPQLRRRRDVVRYVSVTMAAAVPATLAGVTCLLWDHTISSGQFLNSAVGWYVGDVVGLVGFAPFLLIHVLPRAQEMLSVTPIDVDRESHRDKQEGRAGRVRVILEGAGQTGAIVLALWIMFGKPLGPKELYYIAFIPIIWIAMRQGIRRVATALLAFNFGVVLAMRFFPVTADLQTKVGLLMLSISGTGLIVGSEVTERRRIAHQLRDRSEFLHSLIEHNPLAIVIQDHMGKVGLCNDAFTQLFQYSREEIAGQALYPSIRSGGEEEASDEMAVLRTPGKISHGIVRRQRKDGKTMHVELHAVSIPLESGRQGACIIYKDVSEEAKAALDAQLHAESLHRLVTELQLRTTQMTVLNEMSDLLQCCANLKEAFDVVSQSARKLFSLSTGGAVFVFRSSRNALEAKATWGQACVSELIFSPGECWALRRGLAHWSEKPGDAVVCQHLRNPVPASYLCVPMMALGEMLGVLHVQYDRSESTKGTDAFETLQESQMRLAIAASGQIGLSLASLQLRESLRDQSIRDPLTGLFNRRFMEEFLERELQRARRRKRSLAVVYMDVDHFKKVNDKFGHEAGDAVLRSVAKLLLSLFREEDVVCRYGGEEFVVILPESTAHEAAKRSEELRAAAKSLRVPYQGQLLDEISVSLGVSVFPEHAANGEELLRVADACLYRSKSDGRDRVTVADVKDSA